MASCPQIESGAGAPHSKTLGARACRVPQNLGRKAGVTKAAEGIEALDRALQQTRSSREPWGRTLCLMADCVIADGALTGWIVELDCQAKSVHRSSKITESMGVAIQCILEKDVPDIPLMEGKSLAMAYCGDPGGGDFMDTAEGGDVIAIDFGGAKPQHSTAHENESLLAPLDPFIAGIEAPSGTMLPRDWLRSGPYLRNWVRA